MLREHFQTEVVLSCWILTAQWHQKGLMYGVENRFKMLLLLGLKRPHCGMRFQQPSTTSGVQGRVRLVHVRAQGYAEAGDLVFLRWSLGAGIAWCSGDPLRSRESCIFKRCSTSCITPFRCNCTVQLQQLRTTSPMPPLPLALPAHISMRVLRWDKIDYPDTDQWGSFKAQQKLHFKAVFHAVH